MAILMPSKRCNPWSVKPLVTRNRRKKEGMDLEVILTKKFLYLHGLSSTSDLNGI